VKWVYNFVLILKKSDYPPMFVDNEYIEDNKKKADAFNIFFVTRQWLTPDGTGAINAQSFDFVLPYGEDVSDVE
jgi:hypothetical protein